MKALDYHHVAKQMDEADQFRREAVRSIQQRHRDGRARMNQRLEARLKKNKLKKKEDTTSEGQAEANTMGKPAKMPATLDAFLVHRELFTTSNKLGR